PGRGGGAAVSGGETARLCEVGVALIDGVRHWWVRNAFTKPPQRRLRGLTACGLMFDRHSHGLVFMQVARSVSCPTCRKVMGNTAQGRLALAAGREGPQEAG